MREKPDHFPKLRRTRPYQAKGGIQAWGLGLRTILIVSLVLLGLGPFLCLGELGNMGSQPVWAATLPEESSAEQGQESLDEPAEGEAEKEAAGEEGATDSDSSQPHSEEETTAATKPFPSLGRWSDYFDGRVGTWPSLEQIGSRSYLVIDADTGEEILSHNPDGPAYPASMTKILTAITVLEHPDYAPDRLIRFSERAVAMPSPESSTAGFVAGEECPTIVALYAMMIRSANEVANALAENYGGSLDGFMELANAKAKEIGCENTHFVDPAGFGLEDHVTTARDMAKLVAHAMKNDVFRDIVTTKCLILPATNIHVFNGWFTVFNGNGLMMGQDAGYQSKYLKSIDGVKTGTTDIAGYCLSSAATTYDDRHLICVIFNAHLQNSDYEYFVNPSTFSYVLLQEAAMRLGCPEGRPDYSDKDYRMQWSATPPGSFTEATVTETAPTEAPTTIATQPTPTSDPTGMLVPKTAIILKTWHILLVMLIIILLVFTAFLLGMKARQKEQHSQRQSKDKRGQGSQHKSGQHRKKRSADYDRYSDSYRSDGDWSNEYDQAGDRSRRPRKPGPRSSRRWDNDESTQSIRTEGYYQRRPRPQRRPDDTWTQAPADYWKQSPEDSLKPVDGRAWRGPREETWSSDPNQGSRGGQIAYLHPDQQGYFDQPQEPYYDQPQQAQPDKTQRQPSSYWDNPDRPEGPAGPNRPTVPDQGPQRPQGYGPDQGSQGTQGYGPDEGHQGYGPDQGPQG